MIMIRSTTLYFADYHKAIHVKYFFYNVCAKKMNYTNISGERFRTFANAFKYLD